MIKIVSIITVLTLLNACNLCERSTSEETVQCLNSMQKREIGSNPKVASYLKKHPVIVSLTTSPARLPDLLPTLQTLDLTHVNKIWLTLPKKYKNKEEYGPVPEAVLRFPKLEVIGREEFDYGPITKMLLSVEKAGKLDLDAIVISIDDDVGFPIGSMNELIEHAILYPDAVVSGAGNYVEIFGILKEEWPQKSKATKTPHCGGASVSYCDTVEGWKAVAYKPRLVNVARMKEVSQISFACRTSDDLVISYVLSESGVERIRVSNEFFQDIHRFDSGSDEGALHKIHLNIPGWSPRRSVDANFSSTTNAERYQRCVLDIIDSNKNAKKT